MLYKVEHELGISGTTLLGLLNTLLLAPTPTHTGSVHAASRRVPAAGVPRVLVVCGDSMGNLLWQRVPATVFRVNAAAKGACF